MKALIGALMVLASCCFAAGQNMTDREFAGLKGQVKLVVVSSQAIGPDGTPAGEAKPQSEKVYDEAGSLTHSTTFDPVQLRTTYFVHEKKHVSRSEVVGAGAASDMRLPDGYTPAHTFSKKAFDYEYKFKHDRDGRISEISGHADHGTFVSHEKYVYDHSGRMVSEINESFHGGSRVARTYKLDDNGNALEMTVDSIIHTPDGVKKMIVTEHYSEYAFDKDGNWTSRTVNILTSDGKMNDHILSTRALTYY